MSITTADRSRGVAGVAGLLVAIGGVPWALDALGQPLPSSIPSMHEIARWAGHPITDAALLRGVGLLCWAVWGLFVFAVALEVVDLVARQRRGRARLVRMPRIPGLQSLAGACVLSVMLLFPSRPPGNSLGQRTATPPELVVRRGPARPGVRAPEHPDDADDAAGPGWHPYVVQRYDSPWSIAERHLGHGSRWRELRDDRGRPLSEAVAQPGVGHGSPPRMLHPGDVLLLPAPMAHGRPAPSVKGGQGAVTTPASPRPHAAAPAPAAALLAGPPTGEATAAGPALAPPPAAAAPAPAGHAIPPRSGPVPPVMSRIDDGRPLDGRSDRSTPGDIPPLLVTVPARHAGGSEGPSLPIALLEAGMLSAGAFAVLELLRRRQLQHRPLGRRVRLPTGNVTDTEVALRLGREPELADRVAGALRALVAVTAGPDVVVPPILGAVASLDAVELLLAQPSRPPAPWVSSSEGFRWRLAHDVQRAAALDCPDCSEPLPALAPIGKAATGQEDVLINLEAAGLLTITGSEAEAMAIIRAIATSLIGMPWANAVSLVLVGFGGELEVAPQTRSVASLGQVLPELRSTAAVMSNMLGREGCRDMLEARVRGRAGDGWPPTVLLCATTPADDELAQLAALAIPGGGVAAVVPGGPGVNATTAGWTLAADAVPIPITPLRLSVRPYSLLSSELASLGQLFDTAADITGVLVDEPPYDRIQLGAARPEPQPARRGPAPKVLIRVLGTVEVEGAGEFKRAKSRELAVYLAMHPNGVGEAELDEALWPSDRGRVVPPSTRDSTVSVARTALGGPERLRPAQGLGREKRYQVSAEVSSDFALFCDLHRQARATGAVEPLRAALQLVRGRPFEGVLSGRTFTWVHTEGHARHIESEVGDAADLAATMFLEQSLPLDARWAARQGLAADPLCERLWVRLMEAADHLGESQEIERLMDELDTVLELGGDFSGLHPNTLAAYERYRRRSGRRGAEGSAGRAGRAD